MKINEEETSSAGGFLGNWTNRILAKGRPRTFTSKVEIRNLTGYHGWSDIKGRGDSY